MVYTVKKKVFFFFFQDMLLKIAEEAEEALHILYEHIADVKTAVLNDLEYRQSFTF